MKPFTYYLIYHSHIDNGYTERQERIAEYQADFIKQAVDCALSPAQKNRSPESKFKFTAEGFWAIEQYLRVYGEDGRKRLCEAIRAGFFELTGGYMHFAELLNQDNLSKTLDYAKAFAEENGLTPPQIAMACDVNGFSYGYADAMYDHGIRYFSASINVHQGGNPLGGPSKAFYWITPKGNKILTWEGFAYHKANLLGVIPCCAPVSNPGIPGLENTCGGFENVTDLSVAEQKLFALRDSLLKENYPYDCIPIMGSGLYTDNSPVSDAHCAFIEEWNKRHGQEIKIVCATQAEFFAHLASYAQSIPSYAGDWNDWWTDGALATPRALRLFRNAQRTQELIKALDPDFKIISAARHEALAKNLILYSEHTFNHSASSAAPAGFEVAEIDMRKEFYAVESDRLACGMLDCVTRAMGRGIFRCNMPFEYTAINPHDANISCVTALPVDYWELEPMSGCIAEDDNGKQYPTQLSSTLRGQMVNILTELKPREHKNFILKFGKELHTGGALDSGKKTFENDWYRVRWNERGVTSLYDKKRKCELLTGVLGEPIYRRFTGEKGLAAGPNYLPRTIPAGKNYAASLSGFTVQSSGNIFAELCADYELEGTTLCKVTYRLYNGLPRIEISVTYHKTLVTDAEGMHLALPLAFPGAAWYLDKAGAFIKAGDQLPGSCGDYYSTQRGISLCDGTHAVTINSLDTPMFMFGGLNLWEYSYEPHVEGTAYSWLTNNKWETNFRTECSGCHESRYILEFADVKNPQDLAEIMRRIDLAPVAFRK